MKSAKSLTSWKDVDRRIDALEILIYEKMAGVSWVYRLKSEEVSAKIVEKKAAVGTIRNTNS